MLHYLHHIHKTWSAIVGGEEFLQYVDRDTVELLQLRAPGQCVDDREFLEIHMQKRRILPGIGDVQKREQIWQNILRLTDLIPSSFGLGKDLKFLEAVSKVLKRLVGAPGQKTIRQMLQECFSKANQTEERVRIQVSETHFREHPGNGKVQFQLGVFQLWLFAARHFPCMVSDSPLKEDGQEKPEQKPPDLAVWHKFASLAYNLGFESDESRRLVKQDPDEAIAAVALREARNTHLYEYEGRNFENFKREIAKMFAQAKKRPVRATCPEFFVEQGGEHMSRRCGRPFENAHIH